MGSEPDRPLSCRDPWPRVAAAVAAAWRARPGRSPGTPLRLPGTDEAAAAAETAPDVLKGGHRRGPWSRCGPRTGSCARRGRPGAALGRMCDRRIEEATRQRQRPEWRLAGAGEQERRRPKPTRATQRKSTGNETSRVRSQSPAPPLGLSAKNKVPSRATAPAHRRGTRRCRLPAPLFPQSPPGQSLVRLRGWRRAAFVFSTT